MKKGALRETVAEHVLPATTAHGSETRDEVLARLSGATGTGLVCLTDGKDRLQGVVTLAHLVGAPHGATLASLADTGYPRVHAGLDQEHAASIALHRRVDALPVVVGDDRLIGVMPAQALLQVLRREHVEDLHRLAGIGREASRARHAIEDPPARQARHRLPWLLAGLLGAMLATAAMAAFERTLEQNIAIAFFIPGLVYLSDAIGTQSETIAVRGLSLTRAGIGHLLLLELRTGLVIGAVLGAIAFPAVLAVFGDWALAGAVATALFAAGALASAIGLLLPWGLARLRVDPAYGSGPIATVIQDILTLLVYLAVLRVFGL